MAIPIRFFFRPFRCVAELNHHFIMHASQLVWYDNRTQTIHLMQRGSAETTILDLDVEVASRLNFIISSSI
jgi:hypothetical protein